MGVVGEFHGDQSSADSESLFFTSGVLEKGMELLGTSLS